MIKESKNIEFNEPTLKKLKVKESKIEKVNGFDLLPDDCLCEIFSFVERLDNQKGFTEWLCVSFVCKNWRNVYFKMIEEQDELE